MVLTMRATRIFVAIPLLLACASCKPNPSTPVNESAAILAQRDANLAAHATIYHGGCDALGDCALANRDCSPQALQHAAVALLASGSIALEWEHPVAVAPDSDDDWFVHSDGSGAQYYELSSDVAGDDCGSYCGWHEQAYPATTLFVGGTAFHLTPGGTTTEITDFAACP